MNVALYIAKRYLFSKSSNNAINIMTVISAVGIVIAAAALFIVLSGFSGLKDFTLNFTSYVDPDLKVSPLKGKSLIFDAEAKAALTKYDDVVSFSSIVEERVILEVDQKRKIVTLKGVDENYATLTNIDSILIGGIWVLPESNHIVAGRGVANSLSFGILNYTQPITIYVPKPGKGQITSVKGAFRSSLVNNTGVFNINEDLDNEVVYADIDLARYLLNFSENQVTDVEIKLKPEAEEDTARKYINSIFNDTVEIKNTAQLNEDLYKMLNTENMAVYLIFTLVLIIALFNVIGAMIMMILDKKESIKTLFHLGTTSKEIRRIFFLQGSLMTILGGLFGAFLGLFIVFLQQQFNLVMITSYLPYPVSITLMNFIIVIITIVVLGILASKLASTRITPKLVSA